MEMRLGKYLAKTTSAGLTEKIIVSIIPISERLVLENHDDQFMKYRMRYLYFIECHGDSSSSEDLQGVHEILCFFLKML